MKTVYISQEVKSSIQFSARDSFTVNNGY